MILLDANVLIRLSIKGSNAAERVATWIRSGEKLAICAPAWFEYTSGPVTHSEIEDANLVLNGVVLDFRKEEADLAALLFNRVGRKRAAKVDCMIAASALLSDSRLATANVKDFTPFVTHGLRLEHI